MTNTDNHFLLLCHRATISAWATVFGAAIAAVQSLFVVVLWATGILPVWPAAAVALGAWILVAVGALFNIATNLKIDRSIDIARRQN